VLRYGLETSWNGVPRIEGDRMKPIENALYAENIGVLLL
jgi:hypothetical protein